MTIDAVVFWERLTKLHKAWGVRRATLTPRRPLVALPCTLHGLPLRASGCFLRTCLPDCPVLRAVLQAAREPDGLWKGADALVIDSGSNNEDELYSKSASLQTWLLGYEFPETIIAVCFRTVVILTSKKKGARPAVAAAACALPCPREPHLTVSTLFDLSPHRRSGTSGAAQEGGERHAAARAPDAREVGCAADPLGLSLSASEPWRCHALLTLSSLPPAGQRCQLRGARHGAEVVARWRCCVDTPQGEAARRVLRVVAQGAGGF